MSFGTRCSHVPLGFIDGPFELTPIYFLASRTLDSFSDDDHHDHMVVVRVGSPAVMDRTDNAGKLQSVLYFSFLSLLPSAPVYGPVLRKRPHTVGSL